VRNKLIFIGEEIIFASAWTIY